MLADGCCHSLSMCIECCSIDRVGHIVACRTIGFTLVFTTGGTFLLDRTRCSITHHTIHIQISAHHQHVTMQHRTVRRTWACHLRFLLCFPLLFLLLLQLCEQQQHLCLTPCEQIPCGIAIGLLETNLFFQQRKCNLLFCRCDTTRFDGDGDGNFGVRDETLFLTQHMTGGNVNSVKMTSYQPMPTTHRYAYHARCVLLMLTFSIALRMAATLVSNSLPEFNTACSSPSNACTTSRHASVCCLNASTLARVVAISVS